MDDSKKEEASNLIDKSSKNDKEGENEEEKKDSSNIRKLDLNEDEKDEEKDKENAFCNSTCEPRLCKSIISSSWSNR